MLRAIDRRTHNEYAIDASLHGYKVPFRVNEKVEREEMEIVLPPAEAEKLMAEGLARVRARHGK